MLVRARCNSFLSINPPPLTHPSREGKRNGAIQKISPHHRLVWGYCYFRFGFWGWPRYLLVVTTCWGTGTSQLAMATTDVGRVGKAEMGLTASLYCLVNSASRLETSAS